MESAPDTVLHSRAGRIGPKSLWGRIQVRFLAMFVPLSVLLVGSVLGLSEYFRYQQQLEELTARSEALVARGAAAMASPIWWIDNVMVGAMAEALLANPDLVALVVYDEDGMVLVRDGASGTEPDLLVLDHPIQFAGKAETIPVGRLVVEVSPARTHALLVERLQAIVLTGLVLVLTAILASVLANWRTIQIPLARLQAAMQTFETTRKHQRIDWTAEDDFQYLIAAFNRMQDAQMKYDAVMADRKAFLEEEIERRTHEAEAARTAAEVANVNKSQFLANMCHELRTPLNAIIGFSEVLLFGIGTRPLEGKQTEYVTDTLGSAKLLLSIVDQIINVSKIETGRLPMQLQPVALRVLIRQSIDMQRAILARRGLTVTVPESGVSDLCQADPTIMVQVMNNLIGNAVKFSPDGGEIQVLLADDPAAGLLWVTITDQGPGIPPAQIDAVLQPFVQGTDPFVRANQGFGLGLFITKRYIEAHGGTLTLRNRDDGGTEVRIGQPRLPALAAGDGEAGETG